MAIRKIQAVIDSTVVTVQGFRSDQVHTPQPYVYLAVHEDPDDKSTHGGVALLTIEEANTLGEYLRQAAEFAVNNTGGMTE